MVLATLTALASFIVSDVVDIETFKARTLLVDNTNETSYNQVPAGSRVNVFRLVGVPAVPDVVAFVLSSTTAAVYPIWLEVGTVVLAAKVIN